MDTSRSDPAEQSHETHRRAMRAHLSAAQQHREAAALHRQEAVVQETAALDGDGDTAAHVQAATSERAASQRNYDAADRESDKAAVESQRLARALDDSALQNKPVNAEGQ